MIEDRRVLEKLMEYMDKNKSVATVTIINTDGSTPRGVGSTMLVDEEGNLLAGTIGGGILEESAKKDAANCIKEKRSTTIKYGLGRPSEGEVLPSICGGNTVLFIKVYSSKDHLIIVGAGHVGEKISRMASILGYSVTVLDNREERLNTQYFNNGEELILGDMVQNLRNMDIDSNTYVIIATYGHVHDEEALKIVLHSRAKYIGMIGSRNKVRTCFKNLINKGYSKDELSRVYAPIGLDLGGETPEEIALSIMAEIQAVKHGKSGTHHLKGDIIENI